MRKCLREIAIGMSLAVAVYLVMSGVDILPLLFLAGAGVLLRVAMSGRGIGGSLGAGKNFEMVGASQGGATVASISFEDIGGQEVAKREFLEALDFIKHSDRVKKMGIRPLKGILLTGPPGTGKTLLAKAAANYTDSVFIASSGSEFVEMYAGVGAQRVRQLFSKARSLAGQREKKSAVVFIDEIDVLGGRRGQPASHHEYDQTLNQLLVEMDGISAKDDVRVLVVGATNRPDILDPALLRPGRFDRQVKVDLPDKDGRLHILKLHGRGKPLAADVDLAEMARETFGFSGAHLESLMNEAAILAMRAGRERILMIDLREAVDKVMMGEKLDRKPVQAEKERISFHEIGHALISEMVRPGSVSTVTVTPRGQALGYMRQSPRDDQFLYTRDELVDQIAICVGGAVAEEIVFGNRSTGSFGDFEQATSLAKKVVLGGMSRLGVVSEDSLPGRLLHEAIQEIIHEQVTRVRELLGEREPAVREIAAKLIADERVSGDLFRDALAQAA